MKFDDIMLLSISPLHSTSSTSSDTTSRTSLPPLSKGLRLKCDRHAHKLYKQEMLCQTISFSILTLSLGSPYQAQVPSFWLKEPDQHGRKPGHSRKMFKLSLWSVSLASRRYWPDIKTWYKTWYKKNEPVVRIVTDITTKGHALAHELPSDPGTVIVIIYSFKYLDEMSGYWNWGGSLMLLHDFLPCGARDRYARIPAARWNRSSHKRTWLTLTNFWYFRRDE